MKRIKDRGRKVKSFPRTVDEMSDQEFIDQISYGEIIEIAKVSREFKLGLLAAAAVARAQGTQKNPCPSGMAAIYIESLAYGEMP